MSIPHNFDAEHGLLGILLFDPQSFRRVEGRLKAIDFYEPAHGAIFATIMAMHQDRAPFSTAGVRERLKGHDGFMELGSGQFLHKLADRAPDASMAEGFAEVIAELSVKRQLLRLADKIRHDAMNSGESADKLIANGEAALGIIARGTSVADAWKDGHGLASAVAAIMDGSGKPSFTPTHLKPYDSPDGVGGLIRARMNILAGRPSMGKSAVATALALRMARAGLGIGMFSLEMDEGELGLRLACAAAFRHGDPDNPMYFLANKGQLSDTAAAAMAYGAQELRELPLHFDDRPGLKPSQIGPATKRLLRQWERKGVEPGCIIVDHLTIVAPDTRTGNKVVDIGDISGSLRDLARETGVAFMVLCQLSREVDNRKVSDKRPQMSDLRWSGEIEQDAAQVTFLYRPEKYLREPDRADKDYDAALLDYEVAKDRWRNRILFLNEKNRGGPTQVEVEAGISLGCNALWELNP